jgi:hypothetical protein
LPLHRRFHIPLSFNMEEAFDLKPCPSFRPL